MAVGGLAGCGIAAQSTGTYPVLQRQAFRMVIAGKRVDLYTLRNRSGMVARLTNHGARLVQLLARDRNGRLGDVVLGYDSIAATLAGQISAGATIGRFANRIGGAAFTLDGVRYRLTDNEHGNHLHGGTRGASHQVFEARQLDGRTIRFTHVFPDGEEGYPGTLRLQVTYTLTDADELRIATVATTTRATVVNITNHSFWNLAGAGSGTVLDQVLRIPASRFAVMDARFVPTGELRDVAGTPLDFRTPRAIGERIDADDGQMRLASGYSHSFVLDKPARALGLAADLYDPGSGRRMTVLTTEPAVHVNSANGFSGRPPRDVGKGGLPYGPRSGITFQTMHVANAPNLPNLPSTRLDPDQAFRSLTIFRFSRDRPARR